MYGGAKHRPRGQDMVVNVLEASDENFAFMKGRDFEPRQGEAIVYVKVVAIKPATMKDGDPKALVDGAMGVLVCGQMEDIQAQINVWMAETCEEYAK